MFAWPGSHSCRPDRVAFESTFLSRPGFCMGWDRFFVALPVQPYEWPAAALRDRHLREEEKEAEDGPRRPQPSRWEQTHLLNVGNPQRCVAAFHISSANWIFVPLSIFRFFCECVIWEIEHGRDWDFGGLLRDCSQANPSLNPPPPHWLYPIWTAAVLPKLLPQPPTASTTFTFLFSVSPFIRHILWYSSINSKLWTNRDLLRQGVFSCC